MVERQHIIAVGWREWWWAIDPGDSHTETRELIGSLVTIARIVAEDDIIPGGRYLVGTSAIKKMPFSFLILE